MAKLFFRYGAMNAGKSTALLQVAYNYEERDMRVVLFTFAGDDRAGVGVIASRLGVSRSARVFDAETVFDCALVVGDDPTPPVSCVIVDEAQFLTKEQVRQLHRLANLEGIPVICFGIRSDFLGEAFPGSAALLTLADDITEMKTICACSRKASMNMRVDERGRKVKEGAQLVIGGNTRYRPVCPRCFYAADLGVEVVGELAAESAGRD